MESVVDKMSLHLVCNSTSNTKILTVMCEEMLGVMGAAHRLVEDCFKLKYSPKSNSWHL